MLKVGKIHGLSNNIYEYNKTNKERKRVPRGF